MCMNANPFSILLNKYYINMFLICCETTEQNGTSFFITEPRVILEFIKELRKKSTFFSDLQCITCSTFQEIINKDNINFFTTLFNFRIKTMPRITSHFETREDAPMRHLVLGHSQVRYVWEHYPNDGDNSVCIDWISVSGGHTHELAQMIKDEINASSIPLYISGLIWQNDVTTLNIASACAVIQDLEQFMINSPDCKLAFPEVMTQKMLALQD